MKTNAPQCVVRYKVPEYVFFCKTSSEELPNGLVIVLLKLYRTLNGQPTVRAISEPSMTTNLFKCLNLLPNRQYLKANFKANQMGPCLVSPNICKYLYLQRAWIMKNTWKYGTECEQVFYSQLWERSLVLPNIRFSSRKQIHPFSKNILSSLFIFTEELQSYLNAELLYIAKQSGERK